MNKKLKFSIGMAAITALCLAHAAFGDTITTISGSGNTDTGWNSFTGGDATIGLRAHDSVTGANNVVGNTYSFAVGEVWNFDFSFNSGTGPLTGYNYNLTVIGPGGINQSFSPTAYADNSYGTSATLNGQGAEGPFATANIGNTIMQNSEKITFFPFLGSFNTPGIYDVSTSMLNSDQQGASGLIHIQVGDAPTGNNVADAGATILMLGMGMGLLGLMKQSRDGKLKMFSMLKSKLSSFTLPSFKLDLRPIMALLTVCSLPIAASAGLVTGNLNFGGSVEFDAPLGTVAAVNSWSGVTVGVNGVTPGSALDLFINPGDSVSMPNSLTFGSGVNALWSVGGFTFDLTTSTIDFQNSSFLNASGVGLISGNGYIPTTGLWALSSANGGNSPFFTFSSGVTTPSGIPGVPDGGSTIVMMAAGIGLIFAGRRFGGQIFGA